jgi:hypothetical protein
MPPLQGCKPSLEGAQYHSEAVTPLDQNPLAKKNKKIPSKNPFSLKKPIFGSSV